MCVCAEPSEAWKYLSGFLPVTWQAGRFLSPSHMGVLFLCYVHLRNTGFSALQLGVVLGSAQDLEAGGKTMTTSRTRLP